MTAWRAPAALLLGAVAGCAPQHAPHQTTRMATPTTRPVIELLGSPGCPNTPAMRGHLRAALSAMSGAKDPATQPAQGIEDATPSLSFVDVDQDALPESDRRRGWPTPTVLVNGADLFGSPQPTHAAPGCRIYPQGVPSAQQIRSRLESMLATPPNR